MQTILWIGDAVVHTGFARVTHNVLNRLKDRWNLAVLGVNYKGDPHKYDYPIYPAVTGGDTWGLGRVGELIKRVKPDLVCVMNDPWNVAHYVDEVKRAKPELPICAYMPVDAPNQQAASKLNGVHAIAYTQFGRKELMLGGFVGTCDVIPHGIDTSIYYPMPRNEARQALKLDRALSEDAFIVGNVNRNQPRKRLDLTIQVWAEWWIRAGQPMNAYLLMHCSNRDIGINVPQLARYYGISSQLIMPSPNMGSGAALPESDLRSIYNACDVHISTTLGEGWGLTTHEGMACRVPHILPRYAALAEWAADAALFVPCSSFYVAHSNINTIGGVVDVPTMVHELDHMYRNREMRETYGQKAYARATEAQYQWPVIADQFHTVFSAALDHHNAGGK